MSNSANVTIRQLPNGVDRPLTYEELDTNFQELKNVIDDYQAHLFSNPSHPADSVTFDATGSAYTSTTVQGVLLEAETNLGTHINDTSAHSASSITYSSNIVSFTATDVQDAIDQLDSIVSQHLNDPAAHDGVNIVYQDTTAGLSATNVSQAIEETNTNLVLHTDSNTAHDASTIVYSSTGSSLTDTTVQGAIDSVDSKVETNSSDLTNHINNATAHDASDLTYSGTVPQTDIKSALDQLADKLDTHYGQLNTTSNATAITVTANTSTSLDENADYVKVTTYDSTPHGINNKITQNADSLTINRTGVYRVEMWATVTSSVNTTNIGFKFAENETITLGRKIWGRIGTANDNVNVSGHGLHDFSAGDVITLWVTADKAADITIEDLVFSINELTSI